jgi:hypothetical protein
LLGQVLASIQTSPIWLSKLKGGDWMNEGMNNDVLSPIAYGWYFSIKYQILSHDTVIHTKSMCSFKLSQVMGMILAETISLVYR